MIGAIVKLLTGGLVDKVLDGWQAYLRKEISEAEFESRVRIAAEEAGARISGDVQAALRASPILQRAWGAVLFLQVSVLVWYQIGAPAFEVLTGAAWPDPGVSLEWAYLIVAAMIGAGPLVFRR